jgi:hypothetical protein
MLATLALALTLYVLAVLILLHEGYTHMADPPDSPAKDDGLPWLCYFQLKHASTHEAWFLVCLTNAVTLTVLTLA